MYVESLVYSATGFLPGSNLVGNLGIFQNLTHYIGRNKEFFYKEDSESLRFRKRCENEKDPSFRLDGDDMLLIRKSGFPLLWTSGNGGVDLHFVIHRVSGGGRATKVDKHQFKFFAQELDILIDTEITPDELLTFYEITSN